MRRLWRHRDELGARLRATRPEPPPELLNSIVGRVGQKRSGGNLRVAFALSLTIAALVSFGAFGGIGYASSAGHSFASALTLHDSHSGKANHNNHGNNLKVGNGSAADDQYVGKTPICHRTHSQTNPFVVISVSNNALPAHKSHGDTLVGPGGTCPGAPIP